MTTRIIYLADAIFAACGNLGQDLFVHVMRNCNCVVAPLSGDSLPQTQLSATRLGIRLLQSFVRLALCIQLHIPLNNCIPRQPARPSPFGSVGRVIFHAPVTRCANTPRFLSSLSKKRIIKMSDPASASSAAADATQASEIANYSDSSV